MTDTPKGPERIAYRDLTGAPEEAPTRAYVRRILKHHEIINGVLEADLVSAILAATTQEPPR